MKRYARIEGQEIVWGPGHLAPWQDAKGDIVDLGKLSPKELAALGFHEVEQRGLRDFDARFEMRTGPALSVEGDKPVEAYSHAWRPDARRNMIAVVDHVAEAIRALLITAMPGQMAEYAAAVDQAEQVKELVALGAIPDAAEYAYLAADIGVTVNPVTGKEVIDLEEAAEVVLTKSREFHALNAALRAVRLASKKRIREAATDAAAYEVFKNIRWPSQYQDFVNEGIPWQDQDAMIFNPGLAPTPEQRANP